MSPDVTDAPMTFSMPAAQEVGVRVGAVALDDHVVALGDDLDDLLGHQLADERVVEGDVEGLLVLDQAVVRDDRDALINRGLHGRLDRRAVLGQDDEHLRAIGDELLDVRRLLLGGRTGVSADVRAARSLDDLLDAGLVPLGPALFLEVVPGHADLAAGGGLRAAGAAP